MRKFNQFIPRPQFHTAALVLDLILLLWPAVAYADPGPGSIAGTVTAVGGAPVSGATVCTFDFYTYSLADCDTSGADDGRGGICSSAVRVGVPLHQGCKGAPVDDGPLYDSTVIAPVTTKAKQYPCPQESNGVLSALSTPLSF